MTKNLPNMNEFSPGVMGELAPLLQVLVRHGGDRVAAVADVVRLSPKLQRTDSSQREKRANNVLIGMSQCGLLVLVSGKEYRLTPLGIELSDLTGSKLYDAFASNLLRNCCADELLEVVREIAGRGERVRKISINRGLKQRGFRQTTNESDSSKIRQWLEKAGLVDSDWSIDEEKYEALRGASSELEQEWRDLSPAQQALLTTLRDVNLGTEPAWHAGSLVKEVCQQRYGENALPESDLRRRVISPLITAGWLESEGAHRDGVGRGGKLGRLRPTEKLLHVPEALAVASEENRIRREVFKQLARPLSELELGLSTGSTHARGLVLEAIAIKLAAVAGLTPVQSRVRNDHTAQAEVDLIAEGSHFLFSRWLFQCKNTPSGSIRSEELAREVGLATLLQAHVVVMVTTGRMTEALRAFARGVEKASHLQIVLVDGKALSAILASNGDKFVDILRRESADVLGLKKHQIMPSLVGSE